MAGSTFKTNPVSVHELLKQSHEGHLQLPDFQRSWVWDEDRIKSLLASISRAFPIGALMTLNTGGCVNFKPRKIQGAPECVTPEMAQSLLLDGQQRTTSLYQVAYRGEVVRTQTSKNKAVDRWFYIDIEKALDPLVDREEAIVAIPEDRLLKSDFNRNVTLDLTTIDKEFEAMMYPVSRLFAWSDWQMRFITWANGNGTFSDRWPVIDRFYKEVIQNFEQYQVPVIALDKNTSKEAVCTVFEKVNTGGKALDAFELVTAMFAAQGHELRRDWYGKRSDEGRQHRLKETLRPGNQSMGVVGKVSNTDFLQVIALFDGRDRRRAAEVAGKTGKDLPAIAPTRRALLDMELEAYLQYQSRAEDGFVRAAKFLHSINVFRVFDLPYQSQLVPLAAILADLGNEADNYATKARIKRWYWNGVFGELYGASTESRMARDFLEVPGWATGATDSEPTTVRDATFQAERLHTMRMRLSAAYKGVNALLMKADARDWIAGERFSLSVFFDENVDIHHIFPKEWCKRQGIKSERYDSIINKTPLTARTNRIIGGDAPSVYIDRLARGTGSLPAIDVSDIEAALKSHLVDPSLLQKDDFDAFMRHRQIQLLDLIEQATGKAVDRQSEALDTAVEPNAAEHDDELQESEFTIASED